MPRALTNKLLDQPLSTLCVCSDAQYFLREHLGDDWRNETIRTAVDTAIEKHNNNYTILNWLDWVAYWSHCSSSAGIAGHYNPKIDDRRHYLYTQPLTKSLIRRFRRFLETLPPGYDRPDRATEADHAH